MATTSVLRLERDVDLAKDCQLEASARLQEVDHAVTPDLHYCDAQPAVGVRDG